VLELNDELLILSNKHLELNEFMLSLSQPTVDLKTILSQLMDKLSNYAASSSEVSS